MGRILTAGICLTTSRSENFKSFCHYQEMRRKNYPRTVSRSIKPILLAGMNHETCIIRCT